MARKTRMDEMKKDLQKTAAEARTQLMAVVGATDLAVEKIRVAQEHFVQVAIRIPLAIWFSFLEQVAQDLLCIPVLVG